MRLAPRVKHEGDAVDDGEGGEDDEPMNGVDGGSWYSRSLSYPDNRTVALIGGFLVVLFALVVPFALVTQHVSEAFVFDGHNDLAWALRESGNSDLLRVNLNEDQSKLLMTDLQRLQKGKVGAQFWSVYVPCGANFTTLGEEIDLVYRIIDRYPDALQFAWSADDVMRARNSGKLASLLGMEGAGPLNESLPLLRLLPRLGVRYMTLTHSCSNAWAASCADNNGPPLGLSAAGRDAVMEMNNLGLLVDISHVSPLTMTAVLNLSLAPVMFSHSNAFALCNNSRNVPDDVLTRLPSNGGVVMVNFVPSFLSQCLLDAQRRQAPQEEITAILNQIGVQDVVAHIEHIAKVAGKAHVGFGSDLDGFGPAAPTLNNVDVYPTIVDALAKRGWSTEELANLMSGNILRVMREAEAVAADLQ